MATLVPSLRRRNKVEKEPIGIYIFLTVTGALMALPLYLMVIQSIKPIEELFLWPPRFYVMRPTLENYTDLVLAASRTWVPFTRYVFNSLFVTSVSVVLYVIICCMAAYPLAKMRKMPFAAAIFNACLAALMFAPQVTVIPRYLTVAGLGLIDTYAALIVPGLGGSFGVFFMKQFLEQYPDALLEAARMDGANEWQIFRNVVIPLTRPAWATLDHLARSDGVAGHLVPHGLYHTEAMKTLPLGGADDVLRRIGRSSSRGGGSRHLFGVRALDHPLYHFAAANHQHDGPRGNQVGGDERCTPFGTRLEPADAMAVSACRGRAGRFALGERSRRGRSEFGFHIQQTDRGNIGSRLVPSPKPYVFDRSYEFLGLNGPQDIFYQKDGGYLWVADTGNHRIIQLDERRGVRP